jgi:hypothetical protein
MINSKAVQVAQSKSKSQSRTIRWSKLEMDIFAQQLIQNVQAFYWVEQVRHVWFVAWNNGKLGEHICFVF